MFRLFAVAAFSMLLASCSSTAPTGAVRPLAKVAARWTPLAPLEPVDQAALLQLLHDRDFSELEARLATYLDGAKRSAIRESALIKAYRSFETADPAIYDATDAWVRTHPTSAAAVIARAYCAAAIGWKLRGKKWARETSAQQFDGMYRSHAKVIEDAQAAIAIAPDNPAPYRLLLQIGRNYPLRDFYRIADVAVARFPASFSIWANVIDSRAPNWGGSIKEIALLAERAQEWAAENPRLRVLLGEPFYFEGFAAEHDGRYAEALDLYTKALGFGDDDEYLAARARVAEKLGRLEVAQADALRIRLMFP